MRLTYRHIDGYSDRCTDRVSKMYGRCVTIDAYKQVSLDICIRIVEINWNVETNVQT